MSPLAIVLQGVIVGVALVVVFVLGAGTAIVDYLNKVAAASIADGEDEADRSYDPGDPGPCARHWTTDGSPCGCDPDEDVDELLVEDDPGDAWDRAHDRWTDGQLGVA